MEIGSRIGAIMSADKETVKLFGYGTYMGEEVPPEGFLHDAGIENPKLQLDNGDVVWGYQCWWGSEARTKELIGQRKVIDVRIGEE